MAVSSLFKHLFIVSSLITLITASIIPETILSKAFALNKRDSGPWPYGVIGDSWGSGVSYNDDVLYDKNLDNCLRTKESHGPQLEADTTWTGDFSSGLRDAACSGSQLVDLAKGAYQMGKVGNPNLVVMTSGGNNCGFGRIVDVCIYHSNPTFDYGPAYKDDNDRTGECAKALDEASNYISNKLQQDLINTINDILADPNIKKNPDFLLYLTGYAQFFGTDYDDWCNDESWNIPGRSATPKLSSELRKAFNDRVSQVNDLYKNTVQSQFSKQVRYIDVDSGFSGRRFCEPGASHKDQLNTDTNFDKVYLWNLNYPWQVANQPNPQPENGDGISQQQAIDLFGGNGVTAWIGGSGSGGEGNVPSNGWRLRPFHPRASGYTSIKKAILAQLKSDGLPKKPYEPGTCSFHLDEWQDCNDDYNNLYAIITLYDDKKNKIAETSADKQLGDPINDSDPLHFKSKLPYDLVVVGEHENDYVQFNYNGLQWKSRDTSGPATCSNGGWDPRDGPTCFIGNIPAVSLILPICLTPRRKANGVNSTTKWIVHSRVEMGIAPSTRFQDKVEGLDGGRSQPGQLVYVYQLVQFLSDPLFGLVGHQFSVH